MKFSKRDKYLLAIVGIVAVFGGFWWFIAKPAKADLSAQQTQLEQVTNEARDLKDTVDRLMASSKGEAARTAERLRMAKALPESTETPGVMVQLQRLADRANVELTGLKTNQYTDFGTIRGTEFQVTVTGRFFDVDDFLYRMHRQVSVNEKDQPVVNGRLLATTYVDMNLDQSDPGAGTGGAPDDDDIVIATLKILAFSSVPDGAAAASATATVPAAATTTTAAPASSTTTTTTPSTTGTGSNEPATAGAATGAPPAAAGAGQAVATPSGGAQ